MSNWRDDAACAGMPLELFFPPDAHHYDSWIGPQQRRDLDRMCGQCPVLEQCADHALKRELHGYWAGTLPHEREHMRRKRGIRVEDLNGEFV